jgi:hypothetical protein
VTTPRVKLPPPLAAAIRLAGAGEEDFLWLIAAGETLEAFVYLKGGFVGADWVTSSA